jgi:hypothetical protein
MDHRAVRFALGLTIAGASMLTAGVATWLVTAVGRVTSGPAARDLQLAALALLAGGAACGVAMGFALASAGRARAGGAPVPAGTGGLTGDVPEFPAAAPSLADPRSLMNPPPPSPPPLAPPRLVPPRPFGGQSWAEQAEAEQPPGGQPPGGQSPGDQRSRDQPSGEPPSGEPRPAARVWWRAAHSPASSWDDTSEEWLRSLRGPVIHQPPPHSAE